eukprot:TRINITY_DN7937_c0_g1_i4.p2 TRINITY_DN7937_c0_g1~~TRINITY_DN7937_c0_g1_i4.p2  ORF type:complete len:118 (-),score=15.22 TRINITY_DN7937_c0_g1_i4:67-420(-)
MVGLGMVVAFFFVVFGSQRVKTRTSYWGLVCLVAGGVGNLVDRVCVGGVVDYLHLEMTGLIRCSFFWNLSDLYIDIAVILILVAVFFLGDLDDLEQNTIPEPGAESSSGVEKGPKQE